jgi:hypothetical protein
MAVDWSQAFTFGAIAIVTPLAIRGMGKLFPSKAPIPSELEFSAKEVQKWNLISLPLYLLSWPVIGYPLWLALGQIYQWYSSSFDSAALFIGPPKVALAIPALFGALGLGAVPVTYFLRKKLGIRYEAYCLASSRQYGVAVDSKKLTKIMVPILVIGVLAAIVCIFKAKLAFYDDHLISCGPISCDSRSYSEISEIGKSTHFRAPNGNVVANQDFFLRYKDGTLWAPFMLRGEVAKQDEVAKLLGQKTGLEIKTTEMLPEK